MRPFTDLEVLSIVLILLVSNPLAWLTLKLARIQAKTLKCTLATIWNKPLS